LLVISIIAFWPTYYAVLLNTDFYVHFHAFTALLWFGMLIAQPFLIKNWRLNLHRQIGKRSYTIAGLVILTIIRLAHNRISTAPESLYAIRTYILYLQLSLAFVFGITYRLAIYYRKTKSIYVRLMAVTALAFVGSRFHQVYKVGYAQSGNKYSMAYICFDQYYFGRPCKCWSQASKSKVGLSGITASLHSDWNSHLFWFDHPELVADIFSMVYLIIAEHHKNVVFGTR